VLDHAGVQARIVGMSLPDGWQDAPCAIAIGMRAPDRTPVRSFLDSNNMPFTTVGNPLRGGPPHPRNIVLEFQP
jgi:hypothetical protein